LSGLSDNSDYSRKGSPRSPRPPKEIRTQINGKFNDLSSADENKLKNVTTPDFLRSCQLCRYSRTSQHFMEPEG
jgi:hypothetical protein